MYVSSPKTENPSEYKTELQKKVYSTLEALNIPFERVDCDPAVTMEDCLKIDETLNMKTVKTLFLCNRQKTSFYLFVTKGDKPFVTKSFSAAMGISRVSFATPELLMEICETEVGATTIFSLLLESAADVQAVFDREVLGEKYFGCTDATTTGYMKLETDRVFNDLIKYSGHTAVVIDC